MGKYLYAIIDAEPPLTDVPSGLDGAEIETVVIGRIAAVVSSQRGGRIRPERRKLAAHYDVLKILLRRGAVLPMAFGLVADSVGRLRAVLAENEEAIRNGLERCRGRVEMGLKLSWDVPNVYEWFIALDAELRDARDRVFAVGRTPDVDEKMQLGRLFEARLESAREQAVEKLLRSLDGAFTECVRQKPKSEKEIASFAFLVGTADRPAFEDAVTRSAELFGDEILLELTGPFPPHNFVNLVLNLTDNDEADDTEEEDA